MLMVTAFVDMVGLLMVLPLLPFYTLKLAFKVSFQSAVVKP